MNAQNFQSKMIGPMIALTGMFALALSAHAGEARNDAPTAKVGSVVVNYSDLDLTSSDDAKVLYARLSSAASRACGGTPMAWDRDGRKAYVACHERKLEKAVGKVNHPNVQAVHALRKEGSKVG